MSADYFGFGKEDDGSYRAWRTVQQGSVSSFKIVPAKGAAEPVRHIPYLQPITIELHSESGQLCLMCHSTSMTVFLEGRGLDELADQIAEKRVKSIHVFDPATHASPENDAAVVTKISVEKS